MRAKVKVYSPWCDRYVGRVLTRLCAYSPPTAATRLRRWAMAHPTLVFVHHRSGVLDYLLAAVIAVLGDVMTAMDLATGRVGGELHLGQRVVRTPHATAGGGFAALGNGHDVSPEKSMLRISVVAFSARVKPRTGFPCAPDRPVARWSSVGRPRFSAPAPRRGHPSLDKAAAPAAIHPRSPAPDSAFRLPAAAARNRRADPPHLVHPRSDPTGHPRRADVRRLPANVGIPALHGSPRAGQGSGCRALPCRISGRTRPRRGRSPAPAPAASSKPRSSCHGTNAAPPPCARRPDAPARTQT